MSVENITLKSHGIERNSTITVQQIRFVSHKTFEEGVVVCLHIFLAISVFEFLMTKRFCNPQKNAGSKLQNIWHVLSEISIFGDGNL